MGAGYQSGAHSELWAKPARWGEWQGTAALQAKSPMSQPLWGTAGRLGQVGQEQKGETDSCRQAEEAAEEEEGGPAEALPSPILPGCLDA